jgi:hypothetical protein
VIARDGERRKHDRRQAWRVDRVHLAIAPAADDVRRQVAAPVGAIVAALVVVLDLDVAVREEALRDDEVVRLVAAGNRRRRVVGGEREDDECERAGQEGGPLPRTEERQMP